MFLLPKTRRRELTQTQLCARTDHGGRRDAGRRAHTGFAFEQVRQGRGVNFRVSIIILALLDSAAHAETVQVKYRGAVDLAATGMVGLGFLSPATDSVARGVNSGVVVGDSGGKAFLWTHRVGIKSIQDLLSAAGANVTGWQLTSARGVSANCTVITISGQGIDPSGNNEGWIATLPRSGDTCEDD
jgi:hypothetical protein